VLKRSIFGAFLLCSILLFYNLGITAAQDDGPQSNEAILADINFYNADLVPVLQQLASESGYNLIATPEVRGNISIRLSQVSFNQFLQIVCRSRGLVYEREGQNYFVGVKGQSFFDRDIIGYFHISYADPNQLVELIKKVTNINQDISYDERTRTIIVSASKDVIDQVSGIIGSLDHKMPQITLEVKVIEISNTALKTLANELHFGQSGLTWGESGVQLIISMLGAGSSWNLIFNSLVTKGKARLVTSPSISTMDGKEASILIGNKVPVVTTTTTNGVSTTNVSYIDAGVKLNFTPRVQSGDELIIDLRTQINSLGNKSGDYYMIGAREVDSSIQAKIGQTVFIGGLITQDERESLSKVPILGSIPLLGLLFQNNQNSNDTTELIVTITPRWSDTVSMLKVEPESK
jgi:Type II secretory pathway, component PulD